MARSPVPLIAPLIALLTACAPSPAAPSIELPGAPPKAITSAALATHEAPCKPSPPLPKPGTKPERARIAAGLDGFLAGMVMSDRTDLEARATPYLMEGAIWDLEHFGHAHPFYAHLGTLDGHPSVALASPAAFVAFARTAGLSLGTDAARRAYVMTYLALDPRVVMLLESPKDLRYVVGRDLASMKLDPEMLEGLGPLLQEDVARRREVEDRIAPRIGPMCLRGEREPGGYRGTIHAIVRQQVLVRIDVTLDTSGAVVVRETVLAEKVPVPVVAP